MIKNIFFIIMICPIISCACATSQEELQVVQTRVAADLFGTQTAAAPPAPTMEEADLSGAENPEPGEEQETQVPEILPAATPWLNGPLTEEDQAQLLCYQAAVLTDVDWAIHSHILRTYWPKEYSDREFTINKINELYWYTTHRDLQFIVDKGEPTVINDNVTVYWDKSFYLNEKDLSHCGERFMEKIAASRSKLGYHPWLPEGMGPTKSPPREGQVNDYAYGVIRIERSVASSWVKAIRLQLLADRGISPGILLDLERPIWQAAYDRFGVG